EGTDPGLGRWPELLSRHASPCAAQSADTIRSVDGLELYRGQHWRRYRADFSGRAQKLLQRPVRAADRARARGRAAGTARFERDRDRAEERGRRPCPAADQPAHQFLLPVRTADDERARTERLWR